MISALDSLDTRHSTLDTRRDAEHISLCDALDRVLTKGVVIVGDATISVAGIDLVFLGLQVILTSVETAARMARTA